MGRKAVEEKAAGAPEWIVTFSDMITLLLTFFVLLQSMAKVQVDQHKFETGQRALKTAFADAGISMANVSISDGAEFEHPKPEYPAEEGKDEPENRAIDSHTEMLRRILMDIERMAKITPSPIDGVNKTILPTSIHFQPEQDILSNEAITYLDYHCQQFESSLGNQESTVFVLGIATAEDSEKKQWMMSAKRAAAVAEFIRSKRPKDAQWHIYSWGAGPGGDWVGHDGLVGNETEIVIALMANSNPASKNN
jgi:flagellar motor protein MotB